MNDDELRALERRMETAREVWRSAVQAGIRGKVEQHLWDTYAALRKARDEELYE